jgi:hypothetical protein
MASGGIAGVASTERRHVHRNCLIAMVLVAMRQLREDGFFERIARSSLVYAVESTFELSALNLINRLDRE